MSFDFDAFKKTKNIQKALYDEEDENNLLGGGDDAEYIKHKGDFVGSLESLRFGRVDNEGSAIDKHHFIAVEFTVEQVNWQGDTLPQKPSDAAAGKPKIASSAVREGERRQIFIKLPKRFFEDIKEYDRGEKYMLKDGYDLLGAICRIDPDAVDLSEFHDGEGGLSEDDGAPLKGLLFGLHYKESIVEEDEKKKRREGAYINVNPYPVDQDTMEREDPAVIAERTEAVLEG